MTNRARSPLLHLRLPWLAFLLLTACGSGDGEPGRLPDGLPFPFERPAAGTPITESERTRFTQRITGLWREVDYFRWCSWHSHGLHASYDPDMPDYQLWWQDTEAVKTGDTVTFRHTGGADNIMIRTPKVLSQAIAGYLASKDPVMRGLVIGYAKGIAALFQGMVWGSEDPPVESITARAIFTHNHEYVTADGRRVAVDYDPMKQEERYDWNAHTVPNLDNPYFGSLWIRNMRSKDDVPYMLRVLMLLQRVVQDEQDPEVVAAAELAVGYLRAFATDIVDSGYRIRSKEDGEIWIPEEDLASFVTYDVLIPDAECTAKLAASLLSYGDPLGLDCGDGINVNYESVATSGHYFNYAIVRYYHLAAITAALHERQDAIARTLLEGLAERVNDMLTDDEERAEHVEWDADAASFLLAAGASGLPLTAEEARLVQQEYTAAAEHYAPWPHWDLWDPSVPDGQYAYKPHRSDGARTHVRPEELTYLLEYCGSPWRNPASIDPVDCAVVLDPARWGE